MSQFVLSLHWHLAYFAQLLATLTTNNPRSTTRCLIADPQRQQLSRSNCSSLNPPWNPHIPDCQTDTLGFPSPPQIATSLPLPMLQETCFNFSFSDPLKGAYKHWLRWVCTGEGKITRFSRDYYDPGSELIIILRNSKMSFVLVKESRILCRCLVEFSLGSLAKWA